MKIKTLQKLLVIAVLLTVFFQQSGYSQSISFSPNSGQRGTSFGVTVTGTGTMFVISTTTCVQILTIPPLSLTGVTTTSTTSLNGNLTIPTNTANGKYSAQVYQGPGCTGLLYNCVDCFTVTSPDCLNVTAVADNGVGTLRAAVACAIPGDTVTFDPLIFNMSISLLTPAIDVNKQLTLFTDPANNISITSSLATNTQTLINVGDALFIHGLKLNGKINESLIVNVSAGGALTLLDCEMNRTIINNN